MVPGVWVFKGGSFGAVFIVFTGPKHPRNKQFKLLGKNRDRIFEKLGSDLVVQSSRQGYPAQNFALYHLGMVPGILDLKGEGKPWIFITFLGGAG